MKSAEILSYISFGGIISYLRSTSKETLIFGDTYVLQNIKILIETIEQSERLKITKKASSFIKLKNFKIELEDKEKELGKDRIKQRLGVKYKRALFYIMDKLLEVIKAEASTLFVYILTDKRYSIENLLDKIDKCFAKDVFIALPDNIQYDFKESGKCIATECCTAGAFHVLRGLEAMLKLLLQNLDPKIDLTKLRGWADIIKEIKKHKNKDLIVTCDNCDRIRVNYRNPTNHPEKIYNIEEIQDLFNLCIGVINDLAKYMINKGYL